MKKTAANGQRIQGDNYPVHRGLLTPYLETDYFLVQPVRRSEFIRRFQSRAASAMIVILDIPKLAVSRWIEGEPTHIHPREGQVQVLVKGNDR